MKAMLEGPLPGATYHLKSLAVDEERSHVSCYAVFKAFPYGRGWACASYGEPGRLGLCLRHGVQRRAYPARDEDLERCLGDAAAGLGLVISLV